MKKSLCIVWLLAACLLTSALPALSAERTFTLEEAARHAVKVNPSVEAKLLIMEQARMNVGVAQSYFWPRVSLISGNSQLKNFGDVGSTEELTSMTWTRGVRVGMNLFSGFMHVNNTHKALLTVDMEKARHQQARLELIANVQLQFLQLLESREELKTAEESVSRIETQLKAAQSFVNVGMAPYLNVLQNEVDLSKAQQQVIRVRNDIRNGEVQLNKYLGFLPDQPVNYKGNLRDFSSVINYTEEQAIKTALFSRPDLIVAQKSIAVSYKELHVRMGEFAPRVDLTYDDMYFEREYNDKRYKDYMRTYWAVGLNVSWDIFTGGSTVFATLAERKRNQALQKEYEDTMAGARTDVIRSLLDIKAAKELITTTRKGMDAAQESYAMANKRYMTHTGTITDLLDAQLKLTTAENDASRALMEYQRARSRFFYYIGRENMSLE